MNTALITISNALAELFTTAELDKPIKVDSLIIAKGLENIISNRKHKKLDELMTRMNYLMIDPLANGMYKRAREAKLSRRESNVFMDKINDNGLAALAAVHDEFVKRFPNNDLTKLTDEQYGTIVKEYSKVQIKALS